MGAEIKLFFLNCSFNSDSINDILLWSILDTNESKSQLNIFTFKHSLSTGTFVHDIDFSDDTNCSDTFRVHISSHL